MAAPPIIKVRSPSKINVFLEVRGRRPDGFHELETVMLRTQLADVLEFRATDSDSLTLRADCSTFGPRETAHAGCGRGFHERGADRSLEICPELADGNSRRAAQQFPLDESNLILRAANALRERCGVRCGAEINVAKRIPVQSGLGGGSGNAAAALLTLNRLWKLHLPPAELHQVAAGLGSDINFLLSGCRAAVCRGRGEAVEPIPVRGRFHFVAIRPATGNSTADVFRQLAPVKDSRDATGVIVNLVGGNYRRFAISVFNRLTDPALAINAELSDLIDRIRKAFNVQMFVSGSGSTCFVPTRSYRESVLFSSRLRVLTGLSPEILWT